MQRGLGIRERRVHGADAVDHLVEVADHVVLRAGRRLVEFVARLGYGGCDRVAHRGDEGGVDLLVDGRRARIGDFRRDRVLFLVDVVLDLRPGSGAGHRIDQTLAEVLGQDDRRVVFARLHAFQRLFLADEPPPQLVVFLELAHDLLAGVEIADQIVAGALVVVGHGDLKVAGGRIRIPVGENVEPRVQRRDDGHAERHHQSDRIAQNPDEITRENTPHRSHSIPLFAASLTIWLPSKQYIPAPEQTGIQRTKPDKWNSFDAIRGSRCGAGPLNLAPLHEGSCRHGRLRGAYANRLDSGVRGSAPLRPLRGQLPS